VISQTRAPAEPLTEPGRSTQPSAAACSEHRNALALRHLRGYPMRSYWLQAGDLSLTIAGPMRPDELLDEPRIQQRFQQDDYMPYWANLWPASVALADYLLKSRLMPPHNEAVAVELGCGLAAPGVAAGLLGWRILLSDYDADALAFAEYNAAVNGLRRFAAALIDWREPPGQLQADLVLAADVLYEPRLHGILLQCIDAVLAENGIVIVADPKRGGAQGFRQTAQDAGWTTQLLDWADGEDPIERIPVDLYVLARRR